MITESIVYWILKLDDIRGLMIAIAVIAALSSSVFGTGIAFFWDAWNDEDKKRLSICKKCFFVLITVFSVNALAITFMPSTKQIAMIKIIPAIANSEIADDIPKDAQDIYRLGVEAIKEQLTSERESK